MLDTLHSHKVHKSEILPRGKITVRFCIFGENFSLRKCDFYDNLRFRVPKKPVVSGFLAIRYLPKIEY